MLYAQPFSSTFWLDIRDDKSGHDSLVFGTHALATYCIDTALGESYSPASPLGNFYAVFQGIPGRANCFTSVGIIKKDLRDFSSTTKKDTFYINFANLDSAAQLPGVTTTLRWPDPAYLADRCDSMFMQDREGGVIFPGRIDMFAQSSLVITDVYDPQGANITAPTVKLEIFRYGTHMLPLAVPRESRSFPTNYALDQNYPNPFNPVTYISYNIPKQTHVRLQVFNPLGQRIMTLVDESKPPGTYSVTWDASTRSSGLYFYRMTAGGFAQTRKAIVLK
jgi:hypothetical protein